MALYAAKGGNAASDLYTLDESDGSATSIGSTGRGLTGLAFDPTDGTLYGSTSNNSPVDARSLVTIDPTTGAGTLVGSFGIASDTLADIAFDSNGVLYGYSASGHKLYTVNLGTGAATQVSATTPGGTFGWAMDFDAEDNLFVLPNGDESGVGDVRLVDQTTAVAEQFSLISGSPPYDNGAAFSAGTFTPGKVFYAIDNDFGASAHLVTVDIATGEVVDIGITTTGMDALASDERANLAFIHRFDATDIINPDSPTASVVGGCVQEDWEDWWDFGSNGYNLPNQTLKFTWPHEAGLFKVKIGGQLSANGSGVVNAIVTVNGRTFLATGGTGFTDTTPGSFYAYNGFDGGTPDVYDSSDYAFDPWVVVATGDVVEIQILSSANLTGFSGFDAFQVCTVKFYADTAAPDSVFCTGGINFENVPLGDDWGDVDGWGGQRLIPDEIYAIPANQPGPDDPHTVGVDFPWGVNFTDGDFVALEDGTVYVFIHDGSPQSSGGATPNSNRHWLAVKKYDPGAGTWSQIATLNVNNPNDRFQIDAVTCEVGPDGMVYGFWWELDTYTAGPPSAYLWKWHMVQLDPSDDSITELGTGQNAETATAGNNYYNHDMLGSGGTTRGASIAFSGGDIYVGAEEIPDVAFGSFDQYRIRPKVWRWNSGTWTDLAIPDPSVVTSGIGTANNTFEVIGENGFWDVLVNVVAADADGPKDDGVTVVYNYVYSNGSFEDFPLFTITYTVGSGWGTELLSDFATIVNDADRLNGSYLALHNSVLDISLMWSEKLGKLIMAADIGGIGDQVWDLFQLGETDWELVNPIGPGASAGPWRQSRNSAAIGPDEDVWRGMISEDVGNAINFQPHVIKHSPGYGFGFVNGARDPIGRIVGWEDPQGNIWDGAYVFMEATTNFRIRWVGTTCYIFACLYAEPQLVNDTLSADYVGDWPFGEGFFVLKGSYVPCSQFRPHFYRRVLG